MLVSFIRKVLSPYYYWSQARMISELLSTTSHLCYIGNKYLFSYSSSIQPLVGCILAWKYLLQMLWFLQRSYKEISLLYMWASWDDCIWWGVYKIMSMVHQFQICFSAIYFILIPHCSLMCNIDNVASCNLLHYACFLSKHPNYLLIPYC
jgi:hypothetical protein